MEKIEITKMTLDDFEQIKPILTTDFDDFWVPHLLKSELMGEHKIYLIAKQNQEIVGFAGAMLNFPDLEIMNVVVKKTQRRKGIGKLLLEKLIEMAQKHHFENIFLEVNETNQMAKGLYEKVGFEYIGLRKNYYGENQHARIMVKKINNL